MPALMGHRLVVFLLLAVAVGACGKEIGDACVLASDCSPNGDRPCDTASLGGYCTIQGCDYNTCPDEAVCVRFFTASFASAVCDRDPANPEVPGAAKTCSADELCALTVRRDAAGAPTDRVGLCAPRAAEVRFCMRKCDSTSDCRDGYACRTAELMARDGGEPVRNPADGVVPDDQLTRFCAVDPARLPQ
jgi:hypothetical protein